jgi:hypothetical protein
MLRLRSLRSYGAVAYCPASYSRLLFLSGVVRRITKETRMKKIQKAFSEWGAVVAKGGVRSWIPRSPAVDHVRKIAHW